MQLKGIPGVKQSPSKIHVKNILCFVILAKKQGKKNRKEPPSLNQTQPTH